MQRFWNKVHVGSPDECWEWTAYKNPLGYGKFGLNRKSCQAHRIAYELTYGEISNTDIKVLHKCDNRACCNPNHLFLGTQIDNIRDMDAKGRRKFGKPNRGERAPNHKLVEDDIQKIRQMHNQGYSLSQIAKSFPVCFQEIHRILQKKRWAHIPD